MVLVYKNRDAVKWRAKVSRTNIKCIIDSMKDTQAHYVEVSMHASGIEVWTRPLECLFLFCYLIDKAQYFGLEFFLPSFLFSNEKTETGQRVKLFIELVLV